MEDPKEKPEQQEEGSVESILFSALAEFAGLKIDGKEVRSLSEAQRIMKEARDKDERQKPDGDAGAE